MSGDEGGSGSPARPGGRGSRWAIAFVVVTLVCLAVPVLLIRSAMQRIRGLGESADKVVQTARHIAEGFRTGKVETALRSYATELRGVSRLQFAELKQMEAFERTDSTSLAWGTIPLPDVVVEARGQVVYTYVLDFQKRWDLKFTEGRVEVTAPAPEFSPPALDPSTLVFETKRGSVLRDEVAVRDALQAGLSALLAQRAREHLALVREAGRKTTSEFIRNFFLTQYDDAAGLVVDVRFADEPRTTSSVKPVFVEGQPGSAATPKR